MSDVIAAPPCVRIPVRGGGAFPVRRVYCVGRNFAEHAREMGATVPAIGASRGAPVFFLKPADAVVPAGGAIPYPPGTADLHHEVELVVALGADATCRPRPRPRVCPGIPENPSMPARRSASCCRRPQPATSARAGCRCMSMASCASSQRSRR